MTNQSKRKKILSFIENNRIERIWKLAQVDFKKRYFNTKLGLLWALINPLTRLFVYYYVFTLIGRMTTENYGLYIFSGLLIWLTFAESTNKGLNIFQSKKYLLESIQFKKADLFTSGTLSVFLGFLFNITAYFLISVISGIPIFKWIVLTPLLILNLFILCLGTSMILAVINIFVKDIVHFWAMVIIIGFWSTPTIFPLENFTGILKYLLYINPTSGIIINFRNCMLYGENLDLVMFVFNYVYSLILLGIGIILVKKYWQYALERN